MALVMSQSTSASIVSIFGISTMAAWYCHTRLSEIRKSGSAKRSGSIMSASVGMAFCWSRCRSCSSMYSWVPYGTPSTTLPSVRSVMPRALAS